MIYADLVLYNGNLVTLDSRQPRAAAMAVRDGKIAFVGSDRDARATAGPGTRLIDLGGKTVVPGFCDSHLHLAAYGMSLLRHVDLLGTHDIDDLLGRLADHAANSGLGWTEGRGFDQERMAGGRWPMRADLDRVSTTRPIVITRVCGHAVVVNSAALALVGPDAVASGDAETGLYTENAIAPFRALVPFPTDAEMEEGIRRAAAVALRTGITSVGTLLDEGVEGLQMGALARLRRRGELPIRVTGMPPASAVPTLHRNGIATGFGDDRLRMGGAKFFSDGSMGARTALLAAPYADNADGERDNCGIRIYGPETLKTLARDAQDKGFQIVIHAIGDQAIRESLDAIEFALGPNGDNTYHRHRIEHASLLSPDLLARMAARDILAVVQPQFIRADRWTAERVGPDRAGWVYPFRAMRDAGIRLALSSDCPVERLDAFACLDAVVNRAPWLPDGGLMVEEALHDYCLGSTYALHAEKERGSLEAGKSADFVVLSEDLTRVSASQVGEVRAEVVYVGGVSS